MKILNSRILTFIYKKLLPIPFIWVVVADLYKVEEISWDSHGFLGAIFLVFLLTYKTRILTLADLVIDNRDNFIVLRGKKEIKIPLHSIKEAETNGISIILKLKPIYQSLEEVHFLVAPFHVRSLVAAINNRLV